MSEFADEGARRVKRIASSSSFDKEMLRFMTRESFDKLLGSTMKRQFAIDEVCDLYRSLHS